jgi:hypothetical protein
MAARRPKRGIGDVSNVLGYAIGLIALGAAVYAHVEASNYLHHPEQHPESRDEQMRKLARLGALRWSAIAVVIAVVIFEIVAR